MKGKLFQTLNALVICGSLVGCAGVSVRQPTTEENEAISKREKSIVLMRFNVSVDGRQIPGQLGAEARDAFRLFAANIETGEQTRPMNRPLTPSPEAREKGWAYFLLAPGTYYLLVAQSSRHPGIGARGLLSGIRSEGQNGFRVEVPAGRSLVYAGSFHLSCRAMWKSGDQPSGNCWSKVDVRNETESAASLARELFRPYRPLVTRLAVPYGKPLSGDTRHEWMPVRIVSRGGGSIGSPDWRKRAMMSALTFGFAGPPRSKASPPSEPSDKKEDDQMEFASQSGSSDFATHLGGAIAGGAVQGAAPFLAALYIVYYLPVAVPAGAAMGEVAVQQWKTCAQILERDLQDFDPAERLRERARAGLISRGVRVDPESVGETASEITGQGEPKSILRLDVQRILFRECEEKGSFCPEVAIRARLIGKEEENTFYDNVFVYTNQTVPERIYEVSLPASPSGRKLEDYCGEKGGQILREQFSQVMDETVRQVLADLGAGGQPSSR